MRRSLVTATLVLACLLALAPPTWADCPGNRLANPGFEEGAYKTEGVGTSLSSWLANGWSPWSILGDATNNREVEYKLPDASALGTSYNIHSGRYSQAFFTNYGTHTGGFYQRVQVPAGSRVTFSIWVQIYTGERELMSDGHPYSDLEWPQKEGDKRGPGNYRVWAGIDPYGGAPGFGAPAPDTIVWSEPVLDRETRVIGANGSQIDAWVQLTVSTVAQGEWVTVFTKGSPEFPVKHNNSFWDDACLVVESAPTATPRPTDTPAPTSVPTATPEPTATETPTAVPPTVTPEPTATTTDTPTPTQMPPTETPDPTATTTSTATLAAPTATTQPTFLPTAAPTASPAISSEAGGLIAYGVAAVAAVGVLVWLRARQRS
ncbi:MAG: hypothetical protein ACOX2R_07570 [Anaerolineae bacterium]|jgi:hypothetical protein